MDDALTRLRIGVAALMARAPDFDRRKGNFEGRQQLPYAPEGVNAEYLELREQAMANWLYLAMKAPVQRLDAESLSLVTDGSPDNDAWSQVWLPNDMPTRQKIVFTDMMVHGRGVLSVSKEGAGKAKIRVESPRRVYLHPDPEDPFESAWAVKMWTEVLRPASGLWLPPTAEMAAAKTVAVVYDSVECVRFEKPGAADAVLGSWTEVRATQHGLGEIPFVDVPIDVDADNVSHSAIDDLIPMQNAINTIRFNCLLAMQFSAYRQRIATGYDPILRNAAGDIVYMTDQEGNQLVGPDGQPVPALRKSGRIGVDRMLAFPGKDTKVYDLAESNLDNYTKLYTRFLTDLFSRAQTPPQYAIDRMANLSGDAIAGAESTFVSLVNDLKLAANAGIRRALRLSDVARGVEPRDRTIDWADTEPRSFAQVVDGITKLIGSGFPRAGAWSMLSGATPTKVQGWLDAKAEEDASTFSARMLDQFTSELTPDAPTV